MPCLRDASLSRSEKSAVVASVQGNLGVSAAARQIRRLLRPRGGAAREDVSAAGDVDSNSNDQDDFAAWDAYRKARKNDKGNAKVGGATKMEGEVKEGGRTPNGIEQNTGLSKRCSWRDSGYQLLPTRPGKNTSRYDSDPPPPLLAKG